MTMEKNDRDKELGFMAGAYGSVESVPLLEDLIGSHLLDMVVIAYSKLGSPSGIFQNDGTVFPLEGRIDLFKKYCREICSTEKGWMRCLACDCQSVIKLGEGNNAHLPPELEKISENFPIQPVDEFEFKELKVRCYQCHAGLLELIRAISLNLGEDSPTPTGAIWAGQNKVEGYSFSDEQVRKLAEEIGYLNPGELLSCYKQIKPINAKELTERAESLARTARPVEDSASASFHVKKQSQFDRLSNKVLSDFRTSLNRIKEFSAKIIQKQVYNCMVPAMEEITGGIGNCFSAICEIPTGADELKDSEVEMRVVAQDGLGNRKFEKINIRQTDLEKVVGKLESDSDLKSFSLRDIDWEFFTKLKSAIQTPDIIHAIVGRIPTLQNKVLWVMLLRENCNVLTPRGKLLPGFIKMLDNISIGMVQSINVAYLVAQQQDTVRTLESQKKQLEEKDAQSSLLVENLAHQISRPIMELKQSAYILSQGFSKDAYDSFRACLAELERGCRNFDVYERLTTDFDKRGSDLQTRSSFDVIEIVNQAYKRVKPFSRVERIEILINIYKGYAIPKVVGNPEAILECLVNVLHNAIKYSIGGYPVEVEISQEQSSCVDIRVTNVGIELRKEDRERIFDETVRAETAKAVAIEGSGLGLYVSRKLITLHNSSIRVESCVPGKPLEDGTPRWKTTFIISLRC